MKLENSRMRSEFSSFAIFLDTAISEPAPTAMLLIFPHPKFKPASNHFNNTKTKRMHTSDIYLFNKQIFCFLFCIFRYRRVQRPDFQWNRVYLTIKKKGKQISQNDEKQQFYLMKAKETGSLLFAFLGFSCSQYTCTGTTVTQLIRYYQLKH